jgi:hypothetical protein
MFTIFKRAFVSSNQNEKQHPQIFDLLMLSQKEQDLKNLCRQSIHSFERWNKKYPHQGNIDFARMGGVLLQSQTKDFILLYRMAKRHRLIAFQSYMDSLPPRKVFDKKSVL